MIEVTLPHARIDTLPGYGKTMSNASEPTPPGYTDEKTAFLRRMRRIEGQVRGITRMIDEDVYCIDVLTQVAAVTKALQAVSIGLVEEHLGHCVLTAAQSSPEEGNEKLREATEAIARLVRS